MVTIRKYPQFDKLVGTPPTTLKTSKLNAIRNPTIFEFQRQDFSLFGVRQFGNTALLVFNGQPSFFDNSTSGNIYVYAGFGMYDSEGVGNIEFSATFNRWVMKTNIAYIQNVQGGFVNVYKQNYEIRLEMKYGAVNFETYSYLLKTSVSAKGIGKIDVSQALRYICEKVPSINYSLICNQDLNLSGSLKIRFKEVWKNSTEIQSKWISPSGIGVPETWEYLLAVLQPPREQNNIMTEFDDSFESGEFLSAFTEPTLFVGFPFSISFFWPTEKTQVGFSYFAKVDKLDINKSIGLAGTWYALQDADRGWLQHIILSAECEAPYLQLNLKYDAFVEDNSYIDENYITNYYE
jgi:hypothetical protein